jgi:hypothetical protein
MSDAEVLRLRRLRNAVLRARALAKRFDSAQGRVDSIFSKTAVTCWGIARFITGYLRAHPDLRCQKGPNPIREMFDRLDAAFIALVARHPQRRILLVTGEVERAARELDDVRALTRSPELSDVLGRLQVNVRRLIGQPVQQHRQTRPAGIGLADNWPYLTI